MPEYDTDSERVPPAAPRFQVHGHCVVGHEVLVAMNHSMARLLSRLIYETDIDEDEKALIALGKALYAARSEFHNQPRSNRENE